MIQPWPQIKSEPAGDYRIFRIRRDSKTSPRTGRPHDFFVLESTHWVNVIALTAAGDLVMIEQYRHGSNTVELEIPGGMIDAADPSPVAAGVRELREETGFVGGEAVLVGSNYPNPAIMDNTCFTIHVPNCRLEHAVEWDAGEDIVTRLVPLADIPKLVAAGQIRHALVLVALYQFELWHAKKPAPGAGH